jgi:hypothetical protein
MKIWLVSLSMLVSAFAQQPGVNLTFTPESDRFAAAAVEYRSLWASEGDRMIQALESVSGLKFPNKKVKVIVFEMPSRSGVGNDPMYLRASYTSDVKKSTLVHELGHRVNAQLRKRPKDLDEHRLLFLYLHEVRENLYGKDFADRSVQFERGLKGLYDYDSAWTWALSLTKEERAAKFAEVRKANKK